MDAAVTQQPVFAMRSLADIAATLPGATAVFRRHKLDFCCGGKVSLAAAGASKGLLLSQLEAELGAVVALSQPAERTHTTAGLITLIENRYHAVHRAEFPELIRLAVRVEAVHKAHPDVPRGLADLLEAMFGELHDHMQKEEQVLFPLMRRDGHPMIAQPIAAMLADHDAHGEHLRQLEAMTSDFMAPADACPTWRALYAGCRKLTDDLMEHIHIENNLLFPRFAG